MFFVVCFAFSTYFTIFTPAMPTIKHGIKYNPSPENLAYIRKIQAQLMSDKDAHFGLSRVVDLIITKARKK